MAVLSTPRRFQRLFIIALLVLTTWYLFLTRYNNSSLLLLPTKDNTGKYKYIPSSYDWSKRPFKHPFNSSTLTHLPIGTPRQLPRIQHDFSKDQTNNLHTQLQRKRKNAVKQSAKKSYHSYRKYAFGHDELSPLRLKGIQSFAGWGATLVDSLDTLWIMGLKTEFLEAVSKVATIDWANTTADSCNLFETNIRYLGGLLSAYDLSNQEYKVLLNKAIELADMLYSAFDTPNHMPANNFHFDKAKKGELIPNQAESSAAVGTLSLEFTRLSQLTGDSKYFNAIDGIKKSMERTQDETALPGMWPVFVDLENGFDVSRGNTFNMGASADSAYEYLSKMYLLLGGLDEEYKRMHLKAVDAASKHVVFRPMVPDGEKTHDILFSGTVMSNGRTVELLTEVQHLGCFTGGMFALGGKLFEVEEDVKIGERLARGCAWAYEVFPSGIMPEVSDVLACDRDEKGELNLCEWDEEKWTGGGRLPKPFFSVRNPQYLLRPEAIESVFILYRITGEKEWLDVAWRMFERVKKATETKHAHSAISDVRVKAGDTIKTDSMEVSLSFHPKDFGTFC
ncbi:endoplasmic reticulum mannosyl-oligosaccharide 1,2-alpha-mannosidase [Podospora fimiseda]|uniref:alpha-1,2-Mannosidase n=1 Tax=Podospora fimiseda TaxID=252190 RepID=A0AAN7BU97_9PEZI|nr:endoplasmic reticulum mannosyl-oligosaccharide 1,2-alpha-mannosidase [Podospora fimiseda]